MSESQMRFVRKNKDTEASQKHTHTLLSLYSPCDIHWLLLQPGTTKQVSLCCEHNTMRTAREDGVDW